MSARDLIADCRRNLDAELRACVGNGPSPLFDILRYHLGWVDQQGRAIGLPGGKLLRPILCLLSCQGVSGDYRNALPAAAAVEMVHNFSLIHDDIQDRSPQRRHRPTVWRVWGEAQAINAGDALHVLAHLGHLRLLDRGLPPEEVLSTLRELDRACLELCEGQYLDISFEQETRITLQAYLNMIGKKTAALFAASTRIGAMLGAGDSGVIDGLGNFGKELGLAFQIQDDVLGIWGIEKETGKPSLDDIRTKKKSLPIVHAMSAAQGRTLVSLEDAFSRDILDDKELSAVLAILEEAGSREYCEGLAKDCWDRAWARLDALSLDRAAEAAIRQMAGDLIGRAA